MRNFYLDQIPSQEKSKQGKTRGAQLMSAPSFFFCYELPANDAQYMP